MKKIPNKRIYCAEKLLLFSISHRYHTFYLLKMSLEMTLRSKFISSFLSRRVIFSPISMIFFIGKVEFAQGLRKDKNVKMKRDFTNSNKKKGGEEKEPVAVICIVIYLQRRAENKERKKILGNRTFVPFPPFSQGISSTLLS
jgi:hypothetical protein